MICGFWSLVLVRGAAAFLIQPWEKPWELLYVLFTQETFNKQQQVCVHRASATQFHRYSTMGVCFSTCFVGSVNGGQGTCSGRINTKRLKSNQLFSGQTRLFNQDNSTVGRLTSEDIDKARNAKKTDVKQHKQVVHTLRAFLKNIYLSSVGGYCFNVAHLSFFLQVYIYFCISAQWKSQREEGARHTDRKAGEFWK